MAIGEIKFSELPFGGAIQDADIAPWVQSGVNVKQPSTALLTYMQDKLTSSAQQVYVSEDGVDEPGRGFVNNPYATPDYAISQITDNATKIYNIQVLSEYSIVNLNLKPNVLLNFNNNPFTVTGSVTLDAGWSAGGILFFENSFNLSLPATVDLDFDSVSSPFSFVNISNNIISSSSTITVTSSTSGTAIFFSNFNFGFSGQLFYVINNCYGAILSGASGDITVNQTSNTSGGNFSVTGMTELGNLTVTTSSSSGLTFFNENCKNIGTALYQTTGSGNLTAAVKGMTYFSSLTLDNGSGGGVVNFTAEFLVDLVLGLAAS